MFRRFVRKSEPDLLDIPIATVLSEMAEHGPDSPEYKTLLKYLERLTKLKTKSHRQPISRDTIVIVVGNLLGILIIVAYEQKHVMVSHGLGFVLKPKP